MVSKENEKRIDEWLDAHKDEYLSDLAKLLEVPSVADPGVAPGKYPFGEKSAEVLALAKTMAEGYGFEVENRDNFCNVAHVGSGDEKVGLYGHLDVVPCNDDWNYPAYKLTVDGDMVVGRGVLDDKGPLWASVYSVRCLKELGLLPKREIEIFMGGDEECGMEDIEHYKATSEKLPVVSLTPDGGYPICHGEKGTLRFYFDIDNKNSNVLSITGGTVKNVVAGHAEALIKVDDVASAMKAFDGMERIETAEENGMLKVVATGASVHASTPDNGINAIGLLANAVLKSGIANCGAEKALEFIAMINRDCHGEALGAAVEDEPSGKLTHVGGVIKTLENGNFSLSIDIRYPVTCNGDAILEMIRETMKAYDVEITDISGSKPIYAPADSEFVRMCMDTINGVFHREGWKPYTMGGGTYARKLKNAYALGPEDPDSVSPFGIYRGDIHQSDECTKIKLLMDTAKLYARLLINTDDIKF